jgi:hypothetical protein
MKHETSIALHAYWQSCRGRTGVPANEIRALQLAPILPSLFLVDLDAGAGFRFQFCGASVARRYGRDLSNESFLALWSAEDAESLRRHARSMAMGSTGLVCGMMGETVGGGFTSFEMLLLPLAGESGNAGAIGSMVRVGGHEEMNRIRARIVSQTLRSIRFLQASAAGAAGPEAGPKQAGSTPVVLRRRPHLTVLSGGRPPSSVSG